jgi:protein tyrosine phosphatase type IVA
LEFSASLFEFCKRTQSMIILAEAKQPQSEQARLQDNSRLTISATMSLAPIAEKAAAPLPVVSRKVNMPGSASATGNGGAPGASVSIGTKPTLIDVPPMHFLIMDAPRQSNLHVYIRDMAKHGVAHVVRVCEPTYHAGELQSAGVTLHEMEYKDGTSPPKELIQAWLELVDRTFYGPTTNAARPAVSNSVAPTTTLSVTDIATENATLSTTGAAPSASAVGNGNKAKSASTAIAVHCVAGLGRAPVMVAIALIEFAGMDPVEAVSLIRANRRGAINEKQLLYLEGYKKQYKRRGAGKGTASTTCGCVIS